MFEQFLSRWPFIRIKMKANIEDIQSIRCGRGKCLRDCLIIHDRECLKHSGCKGWCDRIDVCFGRHICHLNHSLYLVHSRCARKDRPAVKHLTWSFMRRVRSNHWVMLINKHIERERDGEGESKKETERKRERWHGEKERKKEREKDSEEETDSERKGGTST